MQTRTSGPTDPRQLRSRLIKRLITVALPAVFIAGLLAIGHTERLGFPGDSAASRLSLRTATSPTAANPPTSPPSNAEPRPASRPSELAGQPIPLGPADQGASPANLQATEADYRYGYTIVELCEDVLGPASPHCQSQNEKESGFDSDQRPADKNDEFSISGRLLDNDGAGLSGFTIIAKPLHLKDRRATRSMRFRTETDSSGAWSLRGMPEGEYLVRSGSRAPYPAARLVTRTGIDSADIVVSRNVQRIAEGLVLDETEAPLEGVTVLPILLGQPSVLTDSGGQFSLPVAVQPSLAVFELRFQRPGYQEQRARFAFGSDTALQVSMQPVEAWTSVSGRVISDTGEALAGRSVELRPSAANQSYRTRTDSDGNYTFNAVQAPADYRLVVYGGSGHKDHEQELYVTPDLGTVDTVVEPYALGEVSGQLLNAHGEPVPDFELVLRNRQSRLANLRVSTDDLGNFEVPAAPAGDLVMASQSTPSILVQGLELDPGEHLHMPLVLDWGEHELHGRIVDAWGNPLPASQIVLQWFHREGDITTRSMRRAAADSQGQFAFTNLGPGPHSLRINAPGRRPVQLDHDLTRQGYHLTVRLN